MTKSNGSGGALPLYQIIKKRYRPVYHVIAHQVLQELFYVFYLNGTVKQENKSNYKSIFNTDLNFCAAKTGKQKVEAGILSLTSLSFVILSS